MAFESNFLFPDTLRYHLVNRRLGPSQADGVLRIYAGSKPGNMDTFDPSLHTSNELATFTSVILLDDTGNKWLYMDPLPSTTISQSGTASWYALHTSSGSGTGESFAIIGDVSNELGDGTLKLLSTSLTSGNTVQLQSFYIKIFS